MSDCLFCRIAAGELKSDIVYQDADFIAFRDIHPQAPHHILIIPRRHIATIHDLEPADAALVGRMVLNANRIADELGISERGYRLVFNCRAEAGQAVYHIHLHLLGGRRMNWPPG